MVSLEVKLSVTSLPAFATAAGLLLDEIVAVFRVGSVLSNLIVPPPVTSVPEFVARS